MKSKATLSLVEYLIMILVFSISIAICLRVFVFSDDLSRQSERKGIAYALAKNTAETLKSCNGDMAKTAEVLGYTYADNEISFENEDVKLISSLENTNLENLGGAVVRVISGENELCSIHVRWQEGLS